MRSSSGRARSRSDAGAVRTHVKHAKDDKMRLVGKPIASLRTAAIVVLGGLSLSACATREYVDEQIAAVNTRVSSVDAKASDAIARADAANAAAQAAANDARTA